MNRSADGRHFVEQSSYRGNPCPVFSFEGLFQCVIGDPKHDRIKNGRHEQEPRKRDKPSSETVDRIWLLEPPRLALWSGIFGASLSIAGFVLLFGPPPPPISTPEN